MQMYYDKTEMEYREYLRNADRRAMEERAKVTKSEKNKDKVFVMLLKKFRERYCKDVKQKQFIDRMIAEWTGKQDERVDDILERKGWW